VRKADNLPPFCAVVTKSGKINFLEPSGPLRTCNGTVFPLPSTITSLFSVLLLLLFNFCKSQFYLNHLVIVVLINCSALVSA